MDRDSNLAPVSRSAEMRTSNASLITEGAKGVQVVSQLLPPQMYRAVPVFSNASLCNPPLIARNPTHCLLEMKDVAEQWAGLKFRRSPDSGSKACQTWLEFITADMDAALVSVIQTKTPERETPIRVEFKNLLAAAVVFRRWTISFESIFDQEISFLSTNVRSPVRTLLVQQLPAPASQFRLKC